MAIPFGLCKVLDTFMRMMIDVFRPFIDDFVIVYLDDILIFNRTWEDHAKHVSKIGLRCLSKGEIVCKDL